MGGKTVRFGTVTSDNFSTILNSKCKGYTNVRVSIIPNGNELRMNFYGGAGESRQFLGYKIIKSPEDASLIYSYAKEKLEEEDIGLLGVAKNTQLMRDLQENNKRGSIVIIFSNLNRSADFGTFEVVGTKENIVKVPKEEKLATAY